MKRTAVTLTIALVAAAEAQAVDGRYSLVAESEHFSFYAYLEDGKHLKVDVKGNERALLDIADQLAVAPPAHRIAYYRHEYPEEVAFHAGHASLWASGVADPATGTIHTVMPAHPHEVVHLVAFQLGDPGRFFHEGLAVALGDKGRLWGQRVDGLARKALKRVSITDALSRFEDVQPELAYPLAGSFVSYLIKQHGVGRVSDFFRRGQAADPGRAVAFQRVFSAPLGQVVAEWRATL